MIKKILVLTGLLASIGLLASAQNDCSNGRYKDALFPTVKVDTGILFGEAEQTADLSGPDYTPNLFTQKLYMDIYQPEGDAETNRPVIVLAFGGAFVFGTRTDAYMVDLCTRYAQLGYVTVSIDYRLTRELALKMVTMDSTAAPRAVLKGTHDMKAAIRFMRKSALADGNPYGIDPNQIYAGGLSAGAFCALHAAYLDRMDEVPEIIKSYAESHGQVEGMSGSASYSSEVAGVISFSGALGDSIWLEAGDVPLVSTHGTADAVVPYGSDSVTILGINYPVDGSSSIHKRANHVGVRNAFYTYNGASHAPESSSVAYRDTGFAFTRDFMYQLVCDHSTAINQKQGNATSVQVYPNPATTSFTIKTGTDLPDAISIIDMTGKTVRSYIGKEVLATIEINDLAKGLYVVNSRSDGNISTTKLLIE